MSLRLLLFALTLTAPNLAGAVDFKDLKAGTSIKFAQDTVVYDLDTAHHWLRDKSLPRWTAMDEQSPVALFGYGLKRRRLPAGTEGVMIRDAYVITTMRGRNYADCMVVFQVGDRHFVLENSDSSRSDDLNEVVSLVRTFPTITITANPGAVATLDAGKR